MISFYCILNLPLIVNDVSDVKLQADTPNDFEFDRFVKPVFISNPNEHIADAIKSILLLH